MRRIERENTGTIKPGQDLVAAGYAGLAGTLKIVSEREGELHQWFSSQYIDQILTGDFLLPANDPEFFKNLGATEWEPVLEGGILKALWDLSGAYMTGISFDLHKIPVRQETIEVCERYDLNPYRLYSEGCFVLAADNGGDLVSALKEHGMKAAVIGKVTDGIKRIIVHEDGNGYLDRPSEDELYKVLSQNR